MASMYCLIDKYLSLYVVGFVLFMCSDCQLILILAEEIPVLVDGLATTLTVQEVHQLVVTLLTFQQTPQATVRCMGK